ncbi:hypothetical protein KPL74_21760 [Bacillus sp. NP157]|nr:hypothetical protein KPL74_21760 [Bacillus sp. NP157]
MQYPGKAPPPHVEPHRLLPAATQRHGLHPIDPATIVALRAIGRRPPPRNRVLVTLAIAVTLVLHILLVLLVQYEMQTRPMSGFARPDDKADVLEVRFIEPAPPPPPRANVPPPPPVSEPPPKVRSPEATRPEPPRPPKPKEPAKTDTPAENAAPATPAPAPSLYGKDGSINMGTPSGQAPPTQASFVSRKPTDDAGVMSHKTTVTYKETRFEGDWVPPNETIVQSGVRKVIENTSLKKEVNIGGQRINCATVLFVLPVGCSGADPSKPPPKSADGRLNMAPSKPLADGPDVVPSPPEAVCIAAFRADKPMPQGCPSDVPLKAIELEKAEQQRRTGK